MMLEFQVRIASATSPDELKGILNSSMNRKSLRAVLSHPECDDSVFFYAYETKTPAELRAEIVQTLKCPPTLLADVVTNPKSHPVIRVLAMRHPNCPQHAKTAWALENNRI